MDSKPRILIVDDEPTARDTLEILLFQENYDLAFATSGSEVINHLEELNPDAILLDVMMPNMNGFEVCEYLKKNKSWRHVPIILITALNSTEDLTCGLDAGADEFLSKPVNGPELRARVRSMLRIKEQHDRLANMLQLREDMANMIVHDMRSPLNTIMGFSELLLRDNSMEIAQLKDISRIRRQAGRLEAFINDLLMLAKMEQGQVILNRSTVYLTELVREVEQEHRIMAESRKINLGVELPSQNGQQVYLDPNLFRRILDNLLTNAFKFSGANTTITLQLEYPDATNSSHMTKPRARIKVKDEGSGIAQKDRERIFDKYGVVASKNENLSQIGLGLAFCKLVTEAHGGRIWVEDNKPQGSIFVVEI